jgi:hypothetical protein
MDGVDRDACGSADVDDFQVAAVHELVDRAPAHAECLAGVLDGEQEDELGVAPGRLARVGGFLGGRFLWRELTATRAEAARRCRAVLGPEPEQVPSGVLLVRVSPPWSSAAVS